LDFVSNITEEFSTTAHYAIRNLKKVLIMRRKNYMTIECEFGKCKKDSKMIFYIGDVKTHYCEEHGKLMGRVFRENNVQLLDKVV
jgi:hypothetical protein